MILADQRYEHIVLMDDADGINGEGNSPTLQQLIASIERNYPNRQVEVARNIIRITPRSGTFR